MNTTVHDPTPEVIPPRSYLSPDCPLAALNQVFPDGIPLGFELQINGRDCRSLQPEALPGRDLLELFAESLAALCEADPPLAAAFFLHHFLPIPCEWLEVAE